MVVRPISGSFTTLDNGPMWCIAAQVPAAGKMWKVLNLSVTGLLMDSAINPSDFTSGLFIVPQNSAPETLNDNNQSNYAAYLRLVNRRAIAIPMVCQSTQTAGFPGGGNAGNGVPQYFFQCNPQGNTPIYVPEGNTIVGVYLSNPGTAIPGPGANSTCQLLGSVLEGDPREFR